MSSFSAARFPGLPVGKEKEGAESIFEVTSTAAEEPSDEALIARICVDDSDALGLLFDRYARLVWTIARRILQNNEEADDLLQDVFLLVRRRASVFDSSKGSVRSLLVQMCYQRAFSRRRDLARQNFYTSTEVTENTVVVKRTSSAPLYDESIEAHLGKTAIKRAREDLSIDNGKPYVCVSSRDIPLRRLRSAWASPMGTFAITITAGLPNYGNMPGGSG